MQGENQTGTSMNTYVASLPTNKQVEYDEFGGEMQRCRDALTLLNV